jgi:hypothetical protein
LLTRGVVFWASKARDLLGKFDKDLEVVEIVRLNDDSKMRLSVCTVDESQLLDTRYFGPDSYDAQLLRGFLSRDSKVPIGRKGSKYPVRIRTTYTTLVLYCNGDLCPRFCPLTGKFTLGAGKAQPGRTRANSVPGSPDATSFHVLV